MEGIEEDEAETTGGLERRMFDDEEDAEPKEDVGVVAEERAAKEGVALVAVEALRAVLVDVGEAFELGPLMTANGIDTPSALTKMLINALLSTSTRMKWPENDIRSYQIVKSSISCC